MKEGPGKLGVDERHAEPLVAGHRERAQLDPVLHARIGLDPLVWGLG